jgi:hypothetical protein
VILPERCSLWGKVASLVGLSFRLLVILIYFSVEVSSHGSCDLIPRIPQQLKVSLSSAQVVPTNYVPCFPRFERKPPNLLAGEKL